MPLIVTQGYGNPGAAEPTPLSISSIGVSAKQLQINLSGNGVLVGNALDRSRYTVISNNGQHVLINSISIAGSVITLVTTEMSNGTNYTFTIPNTGILSQLNGTACIGPFSHAIVGVGVTPTILITKVIDTRTIEIIFSEAVNKYDALNENNYSITNGLIVEDVEYISDAAYRLKTSQQDVGGSYLVTASNIRDLDGMII